MRELVAARNYPVAARRWENDLRQIDGREEERGAFWLPFTPIEDISTDDRREATDQEEAGETTFSTILSSTYNHGWESNETT